LRRTSEATQLLRECRQIFVDANDIQMIGKVLIALASNENQHGHVDAAIRFARDALRYTYRAGDVTDIAIGYNNLGDYLNIHSHQPTAALGSHLMAALIRRLANIGGSEPTGSASSSVRSAASDLVRFDMATGLPSDVVALCSQIGDIPGTDPARLIAELSPEPQSAGQALRSLLAQARDIAAAVPGTTGSESPAKPTHGAIIRP
jgi:hypothetical protein